MASKYLKIPVHQIAISSTTDEKGSQFFEKSYSKVIKTLRIPQEAITSTTGSLYFGGTVDPTSGAQITLSSGVTDLVEGAYNRLDNDWSSANLSIVPSTGTQMNNQGGLWMQIPLNTSRVLWDNQAGEVGPASDNSPETYNKSLWLRISQEVIAETDSGNMVTMYTYPQLMGLGKTGNQAYRVDASSVINEDYYQSKFSYHTVANMLQEKFIKALNSSPGAAETLLDFGKTIDDAEAGSYRNGVVQFPDNPKIDVNKPGRLLVTCATVTSRGDGVREMLPFSPQVSLQPLPTLGETFGISATIFPGTAGIGQVDESGNDASVDQTYKTNPHQLYDSMGTTYSQKIGDFRFFRGYLCDYLFETPISGKKKGGAPKGGEEIIGGPEEVVEELG